MKDDISSIGTRIRDARIIAKLTQTELGERVNKSLRTLQKYESGEIEPSISMLQKIAKVLNVPVGVLLGFDDCLDGWYSIKKDGPPPLPGQYLCIWKGLDHPDSVMDVLNFNGSYFPWERVYSPGRVIVTHWMPRPAWPVDTDMEG